MIDWLLIYKNIAGKASSKEKMNYLKWFNRKIEHRLYAKHVERYHISDAAFTPLSESELLGELKEFTLRVNYHHKFKKRRRILWGSSVAAALALISMIVYWNVSHTIVPQSTIASRDNIVVPTLILSDGNNVNLEKVTFKINHIEKVDEKSIAYTTQPIEEKIEYNTVLIPSKYTYTVILADGTEVMLNANSELRYPTSFREECRGVFLKGEGYFKVKKDVKPFIVTTSDISVKVYGTEFNVNTNKKDFVETLLVSGSLGITCKGTENEVMIKPNELYVLDVNRGESSVRNVNAENYVIWRDGMFKYDNEKLQIALDEIALWYGVEFEYGREDVKDIRISLNLKRTTNLKNILKSVINVSGAVIIKKDENKYEIK